MGHTYVTSGDGVPQGNYPFSAAVADIDDDAVVNRLYRDEFAGIENFPARLTYQAGALPPGLQDRDPGSRCARVR